MIINTVHTATLPEPLLLSCHWEAGPHPFYSFLYPHLLSKVPLVQTCWDNCATSCRKNKNKTCFCLSAGPSCPLGFLRPWRKSVHASARSDFLLNACFNLNSFTVRSRENSVIICLFGCPLAVHFNRKIMHHENRIIIGSIQLHWHDPSFWKKKLKHKGVTKCPFKSIWETLIVWSLFFLSVFLLCFFFLIV